MKKKKGYTQSMNSCFTCFGPGATGGQDFGSGTTGGVDFVRKEKNRRFTHKRGKKK